MGWLESAIDQQRSFIEKMLLESMCLLSLRCAQVWYDREVLDGELKKLISTSRRVTDKHYRLLYAIDIAGCQYSSNISSNSIDDSTVAQDLSHRPYLNFMHEGGGPDFALSEVYLDKVMQTHCITALHCV